MYVDAHVHVIAPGLGVRGETIPSSAVGEFFDVDRILEQTRADRVILSPWVQLLDLDARLHNAALAELVSGRVAVLGSAGDDRGRAARRDGPRARGRRGRGARRR